MFKAWLRNWLFGDEVPEFPEPLSCATCEVYREQLDRMHRYNERLLETLTRPPVEEAGKPYESQVEIRPRFTSWKTRRATLEKEDREKASVMRAEIKPLTEADLEKEIEDLKNARPAS